MSADTNRASGHGPLLDSGTRSRIFTVVLAVAGVAAGAPRWLALAFVVLLAADDLTGARLIFWQREHIAALQEREALDITLAEYEERNGG